MVRRGARLHSDQNRRELREKANHLRPAQFTPKDHFSFGIDHMNLENMLCEINPNRRNLHGGRLLSMGVQ